MQRYMALLDWVMKTSVIGISSFGVSQLKNIGLETSRLNDALVQLKSEVTRINDVQVGVLERYRNLGDRVERLEDFLLETIYDTGKARYRKFAKSPQGDHNDHKDGYGLKQFQLREIRRKFADGEPQTGARPGVH